MIKKVRTHLVKAAALFLVVSIFSCAQVRDSIVKSYQENHYAERVALFNRLNQTEKNIDVLFVGDSLTEQYPLDRMYKNCDFTFANRGISGDTLTGMLNRMQESVFALNPKKIVFLMGTNDLNFFTQDSEASELQLMARFAEFISLIQARLPESQLFIQSLYPVNRSKHIKISHGMVGSRTNEAICDINKKLAMLCTEKGVVYINMYPLLLDDNGNLALDYTKEGLHLVQAGYEVITQELKKYLP